MATTDWALRQIQGLLPLDEESLLQVLDYTSSLTNDAAAEHLKTLLGDSPRALEFISSYNARRNPAPAPAPAPTRSSVSALGVGPFEQDAGVPKSTTKQPKRRAPLHQLPSRKIEGQGDTSGGYQKSFGRDQNAAFLAQRGASTESTPDTTRLSDTPVARQLPKKTAGKLPPSAAGSLISDLPNVKQRTQNQSHNSARNASPAPKTKVTIQGGVAGKGASSTLEDLDAAIRTLELQTNPSLSSSTSSSSRTCNCNAQRHPLLTAAPNCLNCGKIICLREGIGPCTFCNTPLLSSSDITSMLDSLKQERGVQRQQAYNNTKKRADVAGSRARLNPSLPPSRATTPSRGAKGLEAAVAHRDKLLTFQSQNAQRTTVHDEAADVAYPSSVNRWADPAERARQFQQQQRAMREQEERNRPEWEKRGRVLEIAVGKGGVVKKSVGVGKKVEDTAGMSREEPEMGGEVEDAQAEANGADGDIGPGSGGRFSNNPLLAAGMVRPIWEGGKGKGRQKSEGGGAAAAANGTGDGGGTVMKGWRRLEDNEDIILNGGAYGRDRRLGDEERALAA